MTLARTSIAFLLGALLLGACGTAPAAAPAAAVPSATRPPAIESSEDQSVKPMAETPPATAVPTTAAVAHDTVMDEKPAMPATAEAVTENMPDMADEDGEGMAMQELPSWQLTALTNARTGETFRLADFTGKTVYVEPFATWFTTCKRQFGNLQTVQPQLGDDVVLVALSVETNIGDKALADYAADTGFDLVYAVMTPDMLKALAAQFGQTIGNPPAAPHFLIRPDGSTTDLFTGVKLPEDILAMIEAAG